MRLWKTDALFDRTELYENGRQGQREAEGKGNRGKEEMIAMPKNPLIGAIEPQIQFEF